MAGPNGEAWLNPDGSVNMDYLKANSGSGGLFNGGLNDTGTMTGGLPAGITGNEDWWKPQPVDYTQGKYGPNGGVAPDGMYYGSDGTTHFLNPNGQRAVAGGDYWHPQGATGGAIAPATQGGSTGATTGTGNDLYSKFYNRLYSDHQNADGSGLNYDYLSGVAKDLGTDVYGIGALFNKDKAATDDWLGQHGGPKTTNNLNQQTPTQGAQTYNPYAPANQPTLQGYQKNPYLDDMAAGLTRGAVDTWTRSIDPSIRSGAMATGGFGGSRQGVVESNALNDWSKNLSDSLSNLYGNDYQQSQNRNLQKYQGDQSYNLGLGNLGLGYYNAGNNYDLGLRSNDLGYANLDANIAQNNFGNQLSGANFGMNVLDRLFGYNQNATDTASKAQNTQLDYQKIFSELANRAGGQGGTTTGSTTQQSDLLSSILGGGMLGSSLAKLFL